jgi:N-acetylglucosaminyldiphosphoundecaprenol N-acetyl-beta-D-mannosaminyltransferase
MDIKRTTILGISFWNVTKDTALSHIQKTVCNQEKECISFVNADCINISCEDSVYKNLLLTHDCILPDGAGIKIACRLIGEKLAENLNGTDFVPHLCKMAQENKYSIYLLGGTENVVEQMKTNLDKKYPGINICGTHHGYFDKNNESKNNDIISSINLAAPNILLVAFGAPSQEKWMYKYESQLKTNVIMGVGGLFDFFSGHKKRAPMWIRKCNLEWLYRLNLEPRRLWKRYLIGNPLFIFRIIKYRFRKK